LHHRDEMAPSRIGVAGLLAVAAVSPFERPLELPWHAGFQLTTVEAAVVAALLLWAVAIVAGAPFEWRSPITAPGFALLAVVGIAALAATAHQGNALRFAGRLLAAALVCVLARNVVRRRAEADALVDVLLGVGAAVGVIAVLESVRVPAVMEGLRAFRPGFHVVGGQVRATSTFFYPTIASMYLEVVFALGLARLLQSGAMRRAWAMTTMTLVGAGVIATFTRAGLASLALSLGVAVAASLAVAPRRLRDLSAVGTLALLLLVLVRLAWSPEILRTRFATDTAQAWYGARYDVPDTLDLRTGRVERVPVAVENRGLLAWRSDTEPPFALSYHWLGADGDDVLEFDGLRTPFSGEVGPGERAVVDAMVRAPAQAGNYVLVWDVVQEHRTWLSVEGVRPARSAVAVSGPPADGVMRSPVTRLPAASNRAPRLALWRAALEMTAERPLLGVGPDNFRLMYGPRLGLATWDTRVHANNLYLETLVGAGIPALAALLWLLARAGRSLAESWRQGTSDRMPVVAGLTAAWLSMAGHGVVDAFLAFTPTYVVFAIVLGLTFSPGVAEAGEAHADRV